MKGNQTNSGDTELSDHINESGIIQRNVKSYVLYKIGQRTGPFFISL